MKTFLIVPDTHAHPDFPNDRATYLAKLIKEVRPDVVVHLGDSADLSSLSGYDKGKRGFVGRTYRADIDAHLDFQDRMWSPVYAAKRKLPRRIFLIGNHEQRIDRALDLSPELEGTIGYRDLELDRWYDTVVFYEGQTPGVIELNGITFAHYVPTGVSGRPISGDTIGRSLLSKRFVSTVVGHSHLLDYSTRATGNGGRIHGLSAGCYQDYVNDWAGQTAKFWWSGVVILRNVENGNFDPQFISLNQLQKEYTNVG